MALPKKSSRSITVDEARYRWLVSVRQHVLHLTIEAENGAGQKLRASFEPHDQFKRAAGGQWSFQRQGRSLTPNDVTRMIRHGLANGWQPQTRGLTPIEFHTWDAEEAVPARIESHHGEVALRDIAIDQVSDLRYDLSLDPHWRRTLFNAEPFLRIELPPDYFGVRGAAREHGLRFAAFNDGDTGDGFVVFGIASVDFPDVITYTTNNPAIVDW